LCHLNTPRLLHSMTDLALHHFVSSQHPTIVAFND
jgi:hypothetical protein